MKHPAEYVDAQCAGPERPATLTHAQATAAVEQALADAERYKNNLVHALRHCAGPAAVEQVLHGFGEAPAGSGTVLLAGRELPWRVASDGSAQRLHLSPVPVLPAGEEPPF